MRQESASRIATLCAVGLLAVLASATKPAKSAEKANCNLRITGFAQVAFLTEKGVTKYQYAINFRSSASARDGAALGAELVGGGGHGFISGDDDLITGANRLVVWTEDDEGATTGHKEKLSLDLECSGYGAQDTENASTKLYKQGQPQPFVQPWVNGCPKELLIDSRGSGETQGTLSPPGAVFANELRLQYYGRNFFGRDDVIESLANPYPAAGKLKDMLAAILKLPWWYHPSVVAGKKWLARELSLVNSRCQSSRVILTGYSQGAQVSGDVYQRTHSAKVIGLVLFGDPYYNPRDSSDRFGLNSPPNLRYTSNHGGLGKRRAFNNPQVLSFCHRGDPVCQGKHELVHGLTNHKNYTHFKEPKLATQHF